jgi:hypothetical protein
MMMVTASTETSRRGSSVTHDSKSAGAICGSTLAGSAPSFGDGNQVSSTMAVAAGDAVVAVVASPWPQAAVMLPG